MQIPKIIHFIWAGGTRILPGQNLINILQWKNLNPDFQVILWVDSASTPEFKSLYKRLYCKIQKDNLDKSLPDLANILTFQDISELQQTSIYNLVRYEIDRFNPNYGISSDLLRYEILLKHGGAYFDSDVYPSNQSLQNSAIFEEDAFKPRLYVDSNSQGECAIGNDAFICTPNNPLMQLIRDIAINNCLPNGQRVFIAPDGREIHSDFDSNPILDAYFIDNFDYRRVSTPSQTGPDVVKSVVRDKENGTLITSLEYRIEILNPHTSRTLGENDRNWLSATNRVEFSSFEQLINRALRAITFEIESFWILRLPEYSKQCYSALKKQGINNVSIEDIMRKLILSLNDKKINFQNIQGMQWNYCYHAQLRKFSMKHSIKYFEASGLFPNAKNQFNILPDIIGSATNKIESGNISIEIQCNLLYLESGVAHIQDKLTDENRSKILSNFKAVETTLRGLISAAGEVDEIVTNRLEDCKRQLADFSMPVGELSQVGSSLSLWGSRQSVEPQRRQPSGAGCCVMN